MKKTLSLVKRAAKWYFEKTMPYNQYVWCPSGMIPYNYDRNVSKEK